jgi:hypothetical protein
MTARKLKQIKTLKDLTIDPANVNQGTERGGAMLDYSVTNLGYGRSIVADRNGVIIAGNQVTKDALKRKPKMHVVQTSGDELVIVQRTDLDLLGNDGARERARLLALADNRVSEVNYSADVEQLLAHQASGLDISALYNAEETEKMLADLAAQDGIAPDVAFKEYDESIAETVKYHECPQCGHKWPQ